MISNDERAIEYLSIASYRGALHHKIADFFYSAFWSAIEWRKRREFGRK